MHIESNNQLYPLPLQWILFLTNINQELQKDDEVIVGERGKVSPLSSTSSCFCMSEFIESSTETSSSKTSFFTFSRNCDERHTDKVGMRYNNACSGESNCDTHVCVCVGQAEPIWESVHPSGGDARLQSLLHVIADLGNILQELWVGLIEAIVRDGLHLLFFKLRRPPR